MGVWLLWHVPKASKGRGALVLVALAEGSEGFGRRFQGLGGGLEGFGGRLVNTWMLFLSGQSLSVHTTMHVPAAV